MKTKLHTHLFSVMLSCMVAIVLIVNSGCDSCNGNNGGNNNAPATAAPATVATVTPAPPLTPADMDSIRLKPQAGGLTLCLTHFMVKTGADTTFCEFDVTQANGNGCDFLKKDGHICIFCDENNICSKSNRTYTLEFYKGGTAVCTYTIQRSGSTCSGCKARNSVRLRIIPCP